MTRLGIIVSGLLIVAILFLYKENQRTSDQSEQQRLSALEMTTIREQKSQGKADSLAFYLPRIYELSRKIHRGIDIDSVYVTIRYDSTLLHSIRIDQVPLAPEVDRISHSYIYH